MKHAAELIFLTAWLSEAAASILLPRHIIRISGRVAPVCASRNSAVFLIGMTQIKICIIFFLKI